MIAHARQQATMMHLYRAIPLPMHVYPALTPNAILARAYLNTFAILALAPIEQASIVLALWTVTLTPSTPATVRPSTACPARIPNASAAIALILAHAMSA